MITQLATFFGSLLGRASIIAGLVASLIAWRAWDMHEQRAIGEERAVQQMEKKADANAAKADKAAQPVATMPANKLDDRYRRD